MTLKGCWNVKIEQNPFFLCCCMKICVTSFGILFNLEKPERLGCAFLCVTVALGQLLPKHRSTGKNYLKEMLLCFVVSHHFLS